MAFHRDFFRAISLSRDGGRNENTPRVGARRGSPSAVYTADAGVLVDASGLAHAHDLGGRRGGPSPAASSSSTAFQLDWF